MPESAQPVLEGIFLEPANPPSLSHGALDVAGKLRRALSNALTGASRAAAIPRPALADRISELSGRAVTPAMLDRYAAPSCAQWRLPAETVPAVVAATADRRVIEVLVEACGGRVLWGDEIAVAELGALALQERQLRNRRMALTRAMPPERQAEMLDGLRRRVRLERHR